MEPWPPLQRPSHTAMGNGRICRIKSLSSLCHEMDYYVASSTSFIRNWGSFSFLHCLTWTARWTEEKELLAFAGALCHVTRNALLWMRSWADVNQARSIENAPFWLQYKILTPLGVSSSVLTGVNLMSWSGRTGSCENNLLQTLLSVSFNLTYHRAPWRAWSGSSTLVGLHYRFDFMDCCFGSVFGAGVAPSLVTFLFNK